MKADANILKFKLSEFETSADLKDAALAMMSDVVLGKVTSSEANKILKDINAREKSFASGKLKVGRLPSFDKIKVFK
jgi:hypothetical protein